jgi:hypothetical protein
MNELIGKRVTIFCAVYIYTGVLTEVTDTHVKLKDAAIVYETGAFTTSAWADAQPLPHDWCVSLGMVESFGILK